MSSAKKQRSRIAVAGSAALDKLIGRAVVQCPDRFEVVAQTQTFDTAVHACQTQRVDILVVHTEALRPHTVRSLTELKSPSPTTRFLLVFDLIGDDEILAAINAGIDGLIAESCNAAEFAAALDRLADGMNYFDAQSSRVLVRAARGMTLTEDANNSHLTRREKDVVLLIAAGRTNKEIASVLNVSCATVDTHRRNVMCKLGTHNAADLVRYCYSQGWLRC